MYKLTMILGGNFSCCMKISLDMTSYVGFVLNPFYLNVLVHGEEKSTSPMIFGAMWN